MAWNTQMSAAAKPFSDLGHVEPVRSRAQGKGDLPAVDPETDIVGAERHRISKRPANRALVQWRPLTHATLKGNEELEHGQGERTLMAATSR